VLHRETTCHGKPWETKADGKPAGVWLSIDFTKKQPKVITEYLRKRVRSYFWEAEVDRSRPKYGPLVIEGKTKAFSVTRKSFGLFEITEVKRPQAQPKVIAYYER